MTLKIEETSEQALVRVREQARIQLEGRLANEPRHELLLPARGRAIGLERGLATLPERSKGDLLLRYRRRPVRTEDGLDYLFGVLDTGTGRSARSGRATRPARSRRGGTGGVRAFIDFVMERLERDPAHVYHYAPRTS